MNARQPLTAPLSPPFIPPRILAAEAARRLEIAPATFWRMVQRGVLAGFEHGGRRYVSVASFDSYVAKINAAASGAGGVA